MDTIFEFLLKGLAKEQTLKNLESLKRKAAKKYRAVFLPNSKLLKEYHNLVQKGTLKPNPNIENLLIKRPIRSLSGVSVVSVLTKPYACPGNCLFCPSEPGMPKSYLSNEPAAMRAKRYSFDPYKQTFGRIRALNATGHPTDKIELIVIGGSWSALPQKYRQWFVKRCFDACNGKNSKTLEKAKKLNEKAKSRIIGLTLETRPDMITQKEAANMRELGATRIELGVQSVFPEILEINRRGHGLEEIVSATKILKDAGFKVCYHMMVNMPGSTPKKDIQSFRTIFSDSRFQPDLLKIYPCAIVKNSELATLYSEKKYKPYSVNVMKKLLKEIKLEIPFYCRIQRLIRDIPSQSIEKGPAKNSNMRQEIQIEMAKENLFCKCIRCREPKGIFENTNPKSEIRMSNKINFGKIEIFRQDYDASEGKEIFLSFETPDRKTILSLLRLRLPSETYLPATKNSAIVREIHTYGSTTPIGKIGKIQHKGLGKKLLVEAEKITKEEFGLKKISVISGVGAREYYRKQGYTLRNEYITKNV